MVTGSLLSFRMGKILVPRIPRKFQRFESVESWNYAELNVDGYSDAYSRELKETAPGENPPEAPSTKLNSREIQLIASFGIIFSRVSTPDRIRVVDLGGGQGTHFELIKSMFPNLEFDWVVIELPEVIKQNQSKVDLGFRYSQDLVETLASTCDVFLASASLNYIARPHDILVKAFASSRFMVLNRVPIWPIDEDSPAIQHLSKKDRRYGYPTWFFSENRFLSILKRSSKVILSFEVEEDRAYFKNTYSKYSGFVLETNVEIYENHGE